ncbi:hypothetical protein CCMSSC00406_0001552 [Pleurotus cornucopiae]|uniref:Uncharacterized protein n=1 Tax=Pleurotus cornucopiae TaxID=5321 RepID=A0ACB7ILQ7_PLECO|nr:hypothetical protein CCMSSC00406_0001552 [Pleurotus cornucopiae]
MSIAALSAPQSQEDFELTVEPLWTELEGRNLDELTSEVIAGHLLQELSVARLVPQPRTYYHVDARTGKLNSNSLDDYLANVSNILKQQDAASGLTALAIAVVEGFPEEVELLLEKGARPDDISRDGETPLLLATWKATKERSRIIQLLAKTLPNDATIETTNPAANNKTPLMYAIEKEDLKSIRMLRTAGASLTIKDDIYSTAKAIFRPLYPEIEKSTLDKLAMLVLSFLLYVVAWLNGALYVVIHWVFELNPKIDRNIDQRVNGPAKTLAKEEIVKNVDKFIEDTPMEHFFKDNEDLIQSIAQKAVDLQADTDGGDNVDLPKTIKVTLHQQVIYCDDSQSMEKEDRWEKQKKLVERITKITTRLLPDDEGIALRFINQGVDNASNLTLDKIVQIMGDTKPMGGTPIGTQLKSKILQPLVYSKIEDKSLDRPLLVSIITDGKPNVKNEKYSTLADAIAECGDRLDAAGYPRGSVKFLIGQIGSATDSTEFLNSLRENTKNAPVVYVTKGKSPVQMCVPDITSTTDQLDSKFADLKENSPKLDRWLIDTLSAPLLKDEDAKKAQYSAPEDEEAAESEVRDEE